MEQTRHTATTQEALLSREYAGAVNLLAHPVAGLAAAGALGMGMAGHALGLWMGTVAGMAEVSRKLLAAGAQQPQPPRQATVLKLVASRPAAAAGPARKVETPVAPAAAGKAKMPAGIARPQAPDDLKAISGIGPKLEKALNDLGVWSYGQIAALSEAEIAWLDDRMGFSGRIGRDDWIGQARALDSSRTTPGAEG